MSRGHSTLRIFFGLSVFLLLLFSAPAPTLAQLESLNFERLTIQDGLSNNRVEAILQDSKGFMWFGTESGLNRFDGYEFTTYGHLSFSSGSVLVEDRHGFLWMTANGSRLYRLDKVSETVAEYPTLGTTVHQVFEDSHGDLWIARWELGLARYIRSRDSFRVYSHQTAGGAKSPDDNVGVIYEDHEQRLWIGSEHGLGIYDREKDTCMHIDGGPDNDVSSLVEDRKGILWAATNNGLWEIDPSHSLFKRHANTGSDWNDLNYVYEDSRGQLWLGSRGGVARFDRSNQQFTKFTDYLRSNMTLGITWPSRPICEDRFGTVWCSVQSFLARYDPMKQKFDLCSYDVEGTRSADDAVTSAMYEDRSGRMWFGTMRRGAECFDRYQKQFVQVPFGGLSPSVISIHCDSNGILWLGKPDGLCRYDPVTGSRTLYVSDPRNDHTLSGNVISKIVEQDSNTLWLGTYVRGLNKFDKITGRCTQYLHEKRNPGSLGSDDISTLLIDKEKTLWVGTGAGLDRFNPDEGTFTHFPVDSGRGSWIGALFEGGSGKLWVGTGGDLGVFDRVRATYKWYQNDPGDSTKLSNDDINVIYEDAGGTLWIGTNGGLKRFDGAKGRVIPVGASVGLAVVKIIGILEDNGGSLWLLTEKGISKYTPATGTVRYYDQHDGVHIEAGLYSPYFKSSSGELFFGGFSGLVRFNPDSIRHNLMVPPVVLTAFKLFERPVRLDSTISEKKSIVLSYSENVITFEFASLNFTSPEKNQYAYKLEGFDKDWIHSGTKRSATYTNLDGGTYVFRVKACNNDGVWNEEGTSIAVIIAPPPWKTTWAYMAYVVFAGGILYSIRRYQTNKLKVRHQLELTSLETKTLREVDQLKSRFFANISHEFRTPLTLILGPIETLVSAARDEKSREELGMVQRNAKRLLTLVNQLLDLSRIEAGRMKLRARRLDFVELVRGVVASFESLAVHRNIRLSVNWDEPIVGYFDSDVVEKILTNLLSNAFKFTGEGGEVTVRVHTMQSEGGGRLSMTVTDTGTGIAADQLEKIFDRFYQVDGTHTREHEGTGIGLALTRELVQLHKGEISVTSEPGHGSAFTVMLPLGREKLREDEIINAQAEPVNGEIERIHPDLEPSVAMESGESPDEEPTDQRPVILVIEDNADMRRYIRNRLESSFAVLEAENGSTGIEQATASIPDLIVSDVMMPKLDGFELCRRLKEDIRTSHIPIILLTAKAGTDHRIEGYQIGADDYLVKPFDAEELAARITNLVEQRRRLREQFRNEIVLKPSDIAVTPVDEQFLNRVMEIVESHMADSGFGTDAMAKELFMSRMQMHRKLKALTGRGPHEFLRFMRLQRAEQLLRKHAGNISEIAYEVGFSNLSHFAKSFREEFGKTPSEFLDSLASPEP